MFIDNKYTKCYYKIIFKAKEQVRNKSTGIYYESHHIIPRSLNGDNQIHNKVLLTPREHYICHLLLTKMCDGSNRSKMTWALHRLSSGNVEFKIRSRSYELVRILHIKNMAINHPAHIDPKKYSDLCRKSALEQWNGPGSEIRRMNHSKIRSEYINSNKEKIDKHCKDIAHVGAIAAKLKWETDEVWAEDQRKLMSARVTGDKNPMYGKKIEGDHLKKLSEATSRKRWVNKDGQNRYIDLDLVSEYLVAGYTKGKLHKRKESQ